MINKILNKDLITLKNIATSEKLTSVKQLVQLVKKIGVSQLGLCELLEFLIDRRIRKKTKLSYLDGIIFKYLYNSQNTKIADMINIYFKEGIVKLESSQGINYRLLYLSLVSNNFKEANFLTQVYLQQLAGLKNTHQKRKWLYFTDIVKIPAIDLQTIDRLWQIYSEGKFGFSIQRDIWLYNNKDWNKLWDIIGWRINNVTVRYPHEFIWDSTAPRGHLPLFNQLRGVQVLSSLFKHSMWKNLNHYQ